MFRSFDEVKMFKATCCAKKGSTKVFLWHSEANLGLMQNLRWSTLVNDWKPLTVVKKISA